ncbi:hypothetical protein E2C01_072997 [Portunus trituberculatus]|uniref:Uncharacterized protein n=1 Tax=Portunus trituberculatus TaxID=210409 RepID=A0A5B7I9F4_PORTR|nr:hypothetical protein [Portunus trituberculatus]
MTSTFAQATLPKDTKAQHRIPNLSYSRLRFTGPSLHPNLNTTVLSNTSNRTPPPPPHNRLR